MRYRPRSQHRGLFPARLHAARRCVRLQRYWEEDVIDPPVEVSARGTIQVPTSPGLGYHVRRELIERWTTEKETWRVR
jgi:L-alanine-DL-glutamate epimerase-like enolase superfamily enzyme